MTCETEEKMLAELAALRAEVAQLHLCLTGDKLNNVMGIMDILETHRRELYGNQPTLDVGLKDKQMVDRRRIESLEGDRVKVIFAATMVSTVVIIVYSLVKTFLLNK